MNTSMMEEDHPEKEQVDGSGSGGGAAGRASSSSGLLGHHEHDTPITTATTVTPPLTPPEADSNDENDDHDDDNNNNDHHINTEAMTTPPREEEPKQGHHHHHHPDTDTDADQPQQPTLLASSFPPPPPPPSDSSSHPQQHVTTASPPVRSEVGSSSLYHHPRQHEQEEEGDDDDDDKNNKMKNQSQNDNNALSWQEEKQQFQTYLHDNLEETESVAKAKEEAAAATANVKANAVIITAKQIADAAHVQAINLESSNSPIYHHSPQPHADHHSINYNSSSSQSYNNNNNSSSQQQQQQVRPKRRITLPRQSSYSSRGSGSGGSSSSDDNSTVGGGESISSRHTRTTMAGTLLMNEKVVVKPPPTSTAAPPSSQFVSSTNNTTTDGRHPSPPPVPRQQAQQSSSASLSSNHRRLTLPRQSSYSSRGDDDDHDDDDDGGSVSSRHTRTTMAGTLLMTESVIGKANKATTTSTTSTLPAATPPPPSSTATGEAAATVAEATDATSSLPAMTKLLPITSKTPDYFEQYQTQHIQKRLQQEQEKRLLQQQSRGHNSPHQPPPQPSRSSSRSRNSTSSSVPPPPPPPPPNLPRLTHYLFSDEGGRTTSKGSRSSSMSTDVRHSSSTVRPKKGGGRGTRTAALSGPPPEQPQLVQQQQQHSVPDIPDDDVESAMANAYEQHRSPQPPPSRPLLPTKKKEQDKDVDGINPTTTDIRDNSSPSSSSPSSPIELSQSLKQYQKSNLGSMIKLKYLFLGIMILSTIIISTILYYYMSSLNTTTTTNDQEENENDTDQEMMEENYQKFIQSQYDSLLAIPIQTTISERWISTMTSIDTFVTTITSITQISYANVGSGILSTTWPFITIPNYEIRASKFQSITPSIIHLGQYHLVRADQRFGWESYTTTSRGWVSESIQLQELYFLEQQQQQNRRRNRNRNRRQQEEEEEVVVLEDEAFEAYTTSTTNFTSENATAKSISTSSSLELSLVGTIHDGNGTRIPDGPNLFLPLWQSSPLVTATSGSATSTDEAMPSSSSPSSSSLRSRPLPIYNMDGRSSVMVRRLVEQALPELLIGKVVLSPVRNLEPETATTTSSSPEDGTIIADAEAQRAATRAELQESQQVHATNDWLQRLFLSGQPTVDDDDENDNNSDNISSVWTEPVSDIYYPIMNGATQSIQQRTTTGLSTDRQVVGIFTATIQWRRFLIQILPPLLLQNPRKMNDEEQQATVDTENENPVSVLLLYVVVKNSCGQSFTYGIMGGSTSLTSDVEYLGPGDRHDPFYDGLERTLRLDQDLLLRGGGGDNDDEYNGNFYDINNHYYRYEYTGLPLTEDICPYTIHLYPSQDMYQDFESQTDEQPSQWTLQWTLVSAGIFLYCALLLLLYDVLLRVSSRGLWSKHKIKQFIRDVDKNNATPPTASTPTTTLATMTSWTRSTRPLSAETTEDEQKAAEAAAEAEALAEISSSQPSLYDSFKVDEGTEEALVGSFFAVPSTATGGGRVNPAAPGGTPIAELFSDTTVMFADISGFTLLSMTLRPNQVFTLLAKLHGALDDMAAKRKILKVESVGDVYCAVSGIPEQVPDHAIVMAQYASDCQDKLRSITEELSPKLGPTTKQLQFRIGLHSGPVIAGVLPGQRLKFHVVGETVEVAMRMERTGVRGKVHCSKTTAAWIRADGMEAWVKTREERVEVRGRGALHTYWVEPVVAAASTTGSTAEMDSSSMVSSMETFNDDKSSHTMNTQRASGPAPTVTLPKKLNSHNLPESDASASSAQMFRDNLSLPSLRSASSKNRRLVDWNIDVLSRLLRNLVAKRTVMGDYANSSESSPHPNAKKYLPRDGESGSILKEVVEVIEMPEMEAKAFFKESKADVTSMELSAVVVAQLRAFVVTIETMYHNHPYHNFEHASHVGMSLAILLSRLAGKDQDLFITLGAAVDSTNSSGGKTPTSSSSSNRKVLKRQHSQDDFMKALSHHNRTFGISSDPLMQFAIVFAALVHEVDHPGIPNRVLIREFSPLVKTYQGRSMAQQHAIARTWELLAQDNFRELRHAICPTPRELKRFRQIFVSAVLATDFVDRDFNGRRAERWDQAFNSEILEDRMKNSQTSLTLYSKDELDRMATLVMEHLMQASVVSHAMQHWHVFLKWSECKLEERYRAYKAGRAAQDPVKFWYHGETKFFDTFILPLAQKLSDCGVFGEFSTEYVSYAQMNREEWGRRGQNEVRDMVAKLRGLAPPSIERSDSYSTAGSTVTG